MHTDRSRLPSDLVFARTEFDESEVETCDPPVNWDSAGSPAAVTFGATWLRERRSLVLEVPSVVIRNERNYLINPRHPRFDGVFVDPVLEPFVFDDRLLR